MKAKTLLLTLVFVFIASTSFAAYWGTTPDGAITWSQPEWETGDRQHITMVIDNEFKYASATILTRSGNPVAYGWYKIYSNIIEIYISFDGYNYDYIGYVSM